jgi:hypothetical protein
LGVLLVIPYATTRVFFLFFRQINSFNFEDFVDMGKFQTCIQSGGHPDSTGFISAKVGLVLVCIVRIPGKIFEK